MEIQLHPGTGRGSVHSVLLGRRSERALLGLAAVWTLLALSLLWTGPIMTSRWLRHGRREDIVRQSEALRLTAGRVARDVDLLRMRAVAAGDRLTRIAFLYDVPPARWPPELDPEAGTIPGGDAGATIAALERYVGALERGRLLLAGSEEADRSLPRRVPSVLPLAASLFAPSALFGPRVSPWTGDDEFFPGLDLATSAGAVVTAPGAGRVAFTGRVRPSPNGWLWRVGIVAVIDHGGGIATLYGHLGRTDVRVGQPVERGDRIGVVGSSGWALVPQLHYELWRFARGGWRPTDPLFGILDQRLDTAAASLERMRATRVPDPVEALPGKR